MLEFKDITLNDKSFLENKFKEYGFPVSDNASEGFLYGSRPLKASLRFIMIPLFCGARWTINIFTNLQSGKMSARQ